MRKIVVDMMGGDNGSPATVGAVKIFLSRHNDVEVVCVGKKEELTALEGLKNVRIVDARDIMKMDAGVTDVLRAKDSSMVVALNLAKDEGADGIISCGGTGPFLAGATLILKKIPGILRPALTTGFPNLKEIGKYVTILDVGASNVNTPEELNQFAIMGSLYSQAVYGVKEPIVKLLSNGSEEKKGSPVGKEAYPLLAANPNIKFGGNIEGDRILFGGVDVVVSDGFTGNVCLKTTEGVAKGMGKLLKNMLTENLWTKLGALHLKKGVKRFKSLMDPSNVGGAMLLGVNGCVVKAHGNSDEVSFSSAMEVLYKLVEADIVKKTSEALEKL